MPAAVERNTVFSLPPKEDAVLDDAPHTELHAARQANRWPLRWQIVTRTQSHGARQCRLSALIVVILFFAALCAIGQSQEPNSTPSRPGVTGAPARAGVPPAGGQSDVSNEVKPGVHYLPDKDGVLQPVIGFSLEDFEELYKLKNNLDQREQRPRYTIDRLSVVGEARAARAELTVQLTVTLRDAQWVRVPIRLDNVKLREPPKHAGAGQTLVHFEDSREGYVCWLRGDPAQPINLSLSVLAPLVSGAGETRLRLPAPRATVSELKLTVPIARASARVVDGGDLLGTTSIDGDKTLINVNGIGGETTVAWRAPAEPPTATPVVLESMGALLVRIDGRSVSTDARLSIRSFGGPFDSFRLRLPPKAELVGSTPTGVTILPVSEPGADGAAGKIVEIKLDRKTSGPFELRLGTERQYNVTQPDETLELAGFDVVGAVRQWGHIAVEVVGNWQVVWEPSHSVRQVDDLPENLRRDDLLAGFEYFVQPCSLVAQVTQKKTRVSVDPDYLLQVGSERVRLYATLRYKVRGAKVRALEIDAPGWRVEDVGPRNLINVEATPAGAEGVLSLPLAQPTSGDFELTLEASREIAKNSDSLSLEIPRPIAEAIGQALVVVSPDDNVELYPRNDALVGLAAQPLKTAQPLKALGKLPDRQQDPLIYRAETSPARFVSDFRVHEKSVLVESIAQVDVGERESSVTERLIYHVSYEPIDRVLLRAPRGLAADKVQVTLDGGSLTVAAAPGDVGPEGGATTLRVPLQTPRIGHFELQVSYQMPPEKMLPATSVSFSLPLITPLDGRLTYNQLLVGWQAGLNVTLRKGPWTFESQPRYLATKPGQIVAVSTEAAPDAALLAVTLKERQSADSTVVDRGWIQTWLVDGLRQERVVYKFTTSAQSLKIALPRGVTPSAVDARLDRTSLALEPPDRDGALTIRLPIVSAPREHVLELKYHFARQDWGAHSKFTAAQFTPEVWVNRLYWQLILPPQEHLLFSPGNYTDEYYWSWDRFGYERRATVDQADLEMWSQGAADGSLLGGNESRLPAANRYLFSRMGPQADLQVWTARRSWLVFGASLAALSLGLAFIYLPVLRRPGVFAALAAMLLFGALTEPESTLLLAQAAALGVALTLVAAWLARRVRVESRPIALGPQGGSSVLERSPSQVMALPIRGVSGSTATAPMMIASPEAKA
jgi:hypothetical protein